MREIVLPEAKPAYEWIFGRAVQKVSPKRRHALLQGDFTTALSAWAGLDGNVGPEWRFRLTPPDGEPRVVVPDVAYVATDRLRALAPEDREEPAIAPDVTVEVRSPDDRPRILAEKVRVYLAAGTRLVIVADPQTETVRLVDSDGERTLRACDTLTHPALPGFALALEPLFARLR